MSEQTYSAGRRNGDVPQPITALNERTRPLVDAARELKVEIKHLRALLFELRDQLSTALLPESPAKDEIKPAEPRDVTSPLEEELNETRRSVTEIGHMVIDLQRRLRT